MWSGDGGRRWVGDGRGISVVPDPVWSSSVAGSDGPLPVDDVPAVVPGARYCLGRRYGEAVSGLV